MTKKKQSKEINRKRAQNWIQNIKSLVRQAKFILENIEEQTEFIEEELKKKETKK